MEYSFEFSFWILNFYYASWLNETSWDEPEDALPKVDDCEAPIFPSPTLIIWLALVPAVVCATQLPGSLLYHSHATFYRLSPLPGLADCFATYALVGKALVMGHPWQQSVVGVLLVRQGIGQNDLWWRKFKSPTMTPIDESACSSDAEDEGETATLAPTESSDEWIDHEVEESHLRSALARITELVSIERIAGSVLMFFILSEAIVLAILAPMMSFLKAIAIIALAYIGSLVMFEMLVWSLALDPSEYSLLKLPCGNVIEILYALNPGDGPFSLAQDVNDSRQLDSDMELESCRPRDMDDNRHLDHTKPQMLAWNTTMKLIAGLFGIAEASVWIVVTYFAWAMKPQLLFLAAVTAIVTCLGLVMNCFFTRSLYVRYGMIRRLNLSDQEENIIVRFGFAALRWLLSKATVVNFNAVVWLGLMVAMFTLERARDWSENDGEELTTLPPWLFWTV
ncbi:hypothetical protein ACHAPT_012591 [Fusarium lateritium]